MLDVGCWMLDVGCKKFPEQKFVQGIFYLFKTVFLNLLPCACYNYKLIQTDVLPFPKFETLEKVLKKTWRKYLGLICSKHCHYT